MACYGRMNYKSVDVIKGQAFCDSGPLLEQVTDDKQQIVKLKKINGIRKLSIPNVLPSIEYFNNTLSSLNI